MSDFELEPGAFIGGYAVGEPDIMITIFQMTETIPIRRT